MGSSLMREKGEDKSKEATDDKLNALFDLYRDSENPDFILPEGVERLLNDLCLSPDEFKVRNYGCGYF